MNGRERLLALFDGRPIDRLPQMPITMMFAADLIGQPYGRYAADHRVLIEGQIRMAEQFDVDHVSVISDPAREAADCGAKIQFFDNQPPAIDEVHALLADKKTLASLRMPDPLGGGRMTDRVEAVGLFRNRIGTQKLIEGWVEGPCAEGADLRGINTLMTDFFDDEPFVRDLFSFVVENGLRFAKAQIEAGADIIGVGDAAASLVGPQIYHEFVCDFEKRLIDGIHALGAKVRLHICGNIRRILPDIGRLGADMVDIDSMVPMAQARREIGPEPVLCGNLDPVKTLRAGTPDSITAALGQCAADAGPRYIVGAGCEVPRDTAHANVFALRDFARSRT